MQITSRFTVAIHVFACIDTFKGKYKLTSEFLASSVNVNPVVIRRLLQQLKAAGLIAVTRGSGGCEITRPLEEITMLDVYRAVDCIERDSLFHFHENPNPECPVGRNIHNVLDGKLVRVQKAMEDEMQSITMAEIIQGMDMLIAAEASAVEPGREIFAD